MPKIRRQFTQSPWNQGVDESIPYAWTTTPWGSNPTLTQAKIYEKNDSGDWDDVTATLMAGSTLVSGDVITCPNLSGLTEGKTYRLEIWATFGTTKLEAWGIIEAER